MQAQATIDTLRRFWKISPGEFETSPGFKEYLLAMGTAGNGAPKPKISGPKPYNAAASKSQPFWANWGAGLNQQSKQIGDGAGKWWADVTKNSKNWKAPKWEMPG